MIIHTYIAIYSHCIYKILQGKRFPMCIRALTIVDKVILMPIIIIDDPEV